MQNVLIISLPVETAAKLSAADKAHTGIMFDEAPPVHHVNCGSR